MLRVENSQVGCWGRKIMCSSVCLGWSGSGGDGQ